MKETVVCNDMKQMTRRFLIFHSKLKLWMIPRSNLQSSADPQKQTHPSSLHHRLIILQKHQGSWHPMQTPPFVIIPLGFGDPGALFHYTGTIISQRKLKSFNVWDAPEERRSIDAPHDVWGMGFMLPLFMQVIHCQWMTCNSWHKQKAPPARWEEKNTIWRPACVGFSQARGPSQSVIQTGLMITPSTPSVTINTGRCIRSHRLFNRTTLRNLLVCPTDIKWHQCHSDEKKII